MQGEYWQNNECQALSTGDHPIMNKLTRATVRLGGTVLLMDKFVYSRCTLKPFGH